MQTSVQAYEPVRAVRLAAAACVVLACLTALVVSTVLHQPLAAGAVATGLLVGALNGVVAGRLIALPVPFFATSMARILALSLLGIAIGLLFGLEHLWLVILGIGVAQLVLAGSALMQVVRR